MTHCGGVLPVCFGGEFVFDSTQRRLNKAYLPDMQLCSTKEKQVNLRKHIPKTEKIMQYEFKSAITRGGGILTPEHLVINKKSVTWKKRNKLLIGVDSISIALDKISSVELDDKVWGVDIKIHSFGGNSIFASCFTAADAKQIKALLTNVGWKDIGAYIACYQTLDLGNVTCRASRFAPTLFKNLGAILSQHPL